MNAAIRHRQGPLAARSIFPVLGIPRVRKESTSALPGNRRECPFFPRPVIPGAESGHC